MTGNVVQITRRIRVADFVAESLHKIASHSTQAELLHKAADVAASSTDPTMITVLEDLKSGEGLDELR